MNQVCVISIYVPDIHKAIEFYTNTLGFEMNKQYGPKIVTLVHGEVPIVLEESEQASYLHGGKSSGVVLGLKTDDIYKTFNVLKEKGVELLTDEPADCPPGNFIRFRDPFGNILEYLQFQNM